MSPIDLVFETELCKSQRKIYYLSSITDSLSWLFKSKYHKYIKEFTRAINRAVENTNIFPVVGTLKNKLLNVDSQLKSRRDRLRFVVKFTKYLISPNDKLPLTFFDYTSKAYWKY